jgi:hypothetical protein
MTFEAAEKLSKLSGLEPEIIDVRPEHWSCERAARLGGVARLEKHGPPGTPSGRKRGGQRTQQLRRQFPEKYSFSCSRKEIVKPTACGRLSEFIGIMLGDGGLTPYQATVSLNWSADREYIGHAVDQFRILFGVSAHVMGRDGNSCHVRASSVELSEFLVSIGLCVGDKVRNGAEVPDWIFGNEEYMKRCIRGLIDTDGCVSRKNYHAKTLAMQINFRNESMPLLKSARKILMELGFAPTRITNSHHIHLTRKDDVKKYIMEIGFSNPKHSNRIQILKDQFRRGAGVAEQGCLLSS